MSSGFVRGRGGLGALLCVALAAASTASAQSHDALATVSKASVQSLENSATRAQQLAAKALECQRIGEEESTPEARMNAFRRGVELARQAIAADERNADAHFALFTNQGRVLELEGAVVSPLLIIEATRELNRTLELNPNHADALAAKGGIYRQLPWALGGNQKKAGEYLARSVELDYENACGARIELAELYRDQGQPELSIPLLQKAVEVARRDKKSEKLARAQALLQELSAR